MPHRSGYRVRSIDDDNGVVFVERWRAFLHKLPEFHPGFMEWQSGTHVPEQWPDRNQPLIVVPAVP